MKKNNFLKFSYSYNLVKWCKLVSILGGIQEPIYKSLQKALPTALNTFFERYPSKQNNVKYVHFSILKTLNTFLSKILLQTKNV